MLTCNTNAHIASRVNAGSVRLSAHAHAGTFLCIPSSSSKDQPASSYFAADVGRGWGRRGQCRRPRSTCAIFTAPTSIVSSTVATSIVVGGSSLCAGNVRDTTVRAVTARVYNVCAPAAGPSSDIVDTSTPVRGKTEANSCVRTGCGAHSITGTRSSCRLCWCQAEV